MLSALDSRAEALESIRDCEREIAALRARQLRILRDLDRRREGPGADELAGVLDVSTQTARDLLEAALRTPELSDRMASLESGEWSFDRAAVTARLVAAGADDVAIAASAYRDIAGVERLRAAQRRITRRSEREAFERRAVRCWASLDGCTGVVHAELAGYDWGVVCRALEQRADLLPREGAAGAAQRRADALVALARDWLDGVDVPYRDSGPIVTVVVDATEAARTNGQAGATVNAGPRVGPETLDEIMCNGSVEVVVDPGSGVPLAVGPTARVVPPKVRRFVLVRDGGCVIDGCTSTYRLEVHHVVPRSRGGTHDLGNLATLCWWHHHVAVHGRGMQIDPGSPPRRRRLVAPGRDP